jgi:hypothetical protein
MLHIPREALDHWFPASEPVSPPLDFKEPSLTTWDTDGLREVRATELLAVLRYEMARSGMSPAEVSLKWVMGVCREKLKAANPSQKLKDNTGKTAGEFVALLRK